MTGEEPTAVTAQGYVRQSAVFKDIFESMLWELEFPGGAVSNSSTSYTAYVDRLHVAAERGSFGLSPSFNVKGTNGYNRDRPLERKTASFQQIAQMDSFAQSILEDRPVIAPGEEGIRDLKVIEAIVRAAETGNRVAIQ